LRLRHFFASKVTGLSTPGTVKKYEVLNTHLNRCTDVLWKIRYRESRIEDPSFD